MLNRLQIAFRNALNPPPPPFIPCGQYGDQIIEFCVHKKMRKSAFVQYLQNKVAVINNLEALYISWLCCKMGSIM